MGVCNQVTFLILYYVTSWLVPLLNVTDAPIQVPNVCRSNRLIRLLLSTTTVTISFNGVVTQNFFAEGFFCVFSLNKCFPGFGCHVTDPFFIPCNGVLLNLLSLIARVKRVTVPSDELCERLYSSSGFPCAHTSLQTRWSRTILSALQDEQSPSSPSYLRT